MGIVRLNKLGLNNKNGKNNKIKNLKLDTSAIKHKKRSSADLNLPAQLAGDNDEFLLLESPAASPRHSKKRSSLASFNFTEENNWD